MRRPALASWTAERAYVLLAVVFGLFFLVATPPFQSPDEVNHFLRIYQISEGRIIGEKRGNTSGGTVPRAVWIEAHFFDRLRFDPDAHTSVDVIRNHVLYGPRFGSDTDGPGQFADFPNTVRYNPAPYLPQVVAILAARAAGLTIVGGAYLCRLAALVTAILLIRASLRLLPESLQWSFAGLALLPMGLFTTSMASPDAVMIGASFAIFGLAIWLRGHPDVKVATGTWLAGAALMAMIALSKIGYFLIPAALAVGLNPRARTAWGRAGLLAVTVGGAFALTLGWLAMTNTIRTPGRDDPGIDANAQLALVLDDPMVFVNAVLFDVSRRWLHYYDSFIGKLGWLDVVLPRWTLTVLTILFVLFTVTRCRGDSVTPLTLGDKLILLAIPILTFIGTTFLQYLDWVTVGAADLRRALQGRYYYPVVPALLIIAPRLAAPDSWAKYRPIVFVLGYGTCLAATAIVLLRRYYG